MKWFEHMSGMQHDPKVRRVINRYGIEGYGLYCAILESIVRQMTAENPAPDLEETCEDLAAEFKTDTAKLNEIANFMINQGLLGLDEVTARITCHKIYNYLEGSTTTSVDIKTMIKNYKEKQKALPAPESENIPDNPGTSQPDKIRLDKIRKDKSKEEPTLRGDYISLTDEQLEELCTIYSKQLVYETIRNMNDWVREKKNGVSPWRQIDGKYGGTRAIKKWLKNDGYTPETLSCLRPYFEKGHSMARAKQLYEERISP